MSNQKNCSAQERIISAAFKGNMVLLQRPSFFYSSAWWGERTESKSEP